MVSTSPPSSHHPPSESADRDREGAMLQGALANSTGGKPAERFLNLDQVVGHAKGDVQVTLKLSAAEAGALKARMAEGSVPEGVTIQTAAEQGTVTFSGQAATIKALLADIYFSPNPDFQKSFHIEYRVTDAITTQTGKLVMYFEHDSKHYVALPAATSHGASISESIYRGVVSSEIAMQDVVQTRTSLLIGQEPQTRVELQNTVRLAPASSPEMSVTNAGTLSALLPSPAPAPAPSAPVIPLAPLPESGPVFSNVPNIPLGLSSANAVSAAPILSGVDPAAYTENGAAFVLDSDVTLVDGDSVTFNGGSLRVAYASASNSGDALSLKSDALGAGAIRSNGSTVEYSATGASWVQVGTVTTDGTAGAQLVIGFNSVATANIAEKIIEHVTYTSTDDNPPATKDITFVVDDGAGGVSASQTLTLTITAVNDAPVVVHAVADQSAAVAGAFSFEVPSNSFADPEGATLTYSATKSDNTALPGWISFNAATHTFTGTPALGDIGTLSLKVTASDGTLSTSDVFDIVVSNNLAASNLTRSETYTEDTHFNFTDIVAAGASATITATLTLSATGAGAITTATSGAVTSTYNAGTGVWSASGARADVNTLLAGATFIPTLNYNSNFTIATHVDDTITTLTGTLTMTGTPANDAPTVATAIPEQMTTSAAGLSYVLPAAATTFTDVEGHAVSYGAVEYWNGTAWTATLPTDVTYTPGTQTLTVAAGAPIGGYLMRIAGTDNGPTPATGYATFQLGISGTALYGTPGADVLNGGAGGEVIIALAGNDAVYGFGGDDTLFGNDGNDVLYGGNAGATASGNDLIYAGAGNDIVYADYFTDVSNALDTVFGGDGNDTIYAMGGDDQLYGENNDDVIYGGLGNDVVDGGAGNDMLYGEEGADTLTGGTGSDTFILLIPNTDSTVTNMDIITDFQQGQDMILPAGYTSMQAATATAAVSTATMLTWEQSGGNTYVYGNGGAFTLKLQGLYSLSDSDFTFATHVGTPGSDLMIGTSGVDVMYGYDGEDTINGGSSDNIYYGGNGNDVLVSGTGSFGDTITGGAGNDVFVLLDPNHSRAGGTLNGDIIMDFVRGQDKIYMANTAYVGISEGAWTAANGNGMRFTFDGTYTVVTDGITFGGGGNNLRLRLLGDYTSSNPGNVLTGADIIITNTTGAGVIHGNSNAEEGISGSAGNDIFLPNAGVNDIWGDDGNDIVLGGGNGTVNFASRAGSDTVFGSGSGEVFTYGTGGSTDNYVNLGGGNDLLYNRGQDTMYAGTGNDIYYGSGYNAVVFGEVGNESMRGGAGAETMIGGDGNDSMDGGSGSDVIWGGLNQDTVTLGGGSDQLWYTALTDSTAGTADLIADFVVGTDKIFLHPIIGATAFTQIDCSTTTVISTVTYTIVKFTVVSGLDPTFQILLQGDLTATLGAGDFIFGNAPYTLNPAGENYTGNAGTITAGADAIFGGIGNDTIDGNGGLDIISGGAGDDNITGGPAAGDTWGDSVDGGAGNDTIQGGNSFDTLFGGDDDDQVKGGDGYDILDGGLGNDTLYGENDGDTITGGAGNDFIYGGNGFDSLDGGAGIDKIYGEGGYDFIIYDSADLSNDGLIDYSGGSEIDRLEGISGAALDASMLDGVDILGIERFQTTGAVATTMVFAATYDDGVGVDSIYGGVITVDSTLGAATLNVDASALSTAVYLIGGSGNDTLEGGDGADNLFGRNGNDSLVGGNGNDTLTGGAGNDTLTGGAGNDVFYYATTSESTTTVVDRILDFTNGQDTFQLIGYEFYNKTFADLTISFSAGDTTILLNNTTFKILLTGDHTADLDATDFILN